MKKYDLIIIGGGGGLKLRPASELGKKVAVIEKEDLGGTCLNRGCIPSKMLIHAADVAEEIRNAGKYDLNISSEIKVDFKKLVTRVTAEIEGDSNGIIESYKKNPNVDFYNGHAKFIDNKTIQVGDQKLTAKKIYIATGAKPFVPNIEGLAETPYMTSREALRNTTLPETMIVIGGGYIGVEIGHLYGGLGTKVHFLARSGLLKFEDEDVSAEFTRVFTKKHQVDFNCQLQSVHFKNNKFIVKVIHGENKEFSELKANSLLVATGIVPNTADLGIENTDIKLSKKGFIEVDDYLQTAVKDVFALGDVIGKYFFRHTVNFEGEYLLRTHYQKPSTEPINYSPVPHAVFSNPQTAGVGKTEEELKDSDVDYVVGINNYKNSAMGSALRSDHGFVKILIERSTKKLLGAHIVGPEASNMIHMLIAYISMNATLDDILNTIFIHPALPENIRNAARNARKSLED